MRIKFTPLEQSIIATFPTGTARLLVAVSGGVDSVVLLHLLHSFADLQNVLLHVAHLDHQIRPEGVDDAAFVRDLCAQLNIPCYMESCDVPRLAKLGKVSLEMAGRQARREFLCQVAGQIGADRIVLAHHQDDQVETFMLRLLRGSGQSGLASMRVHQGLWWRPLLHCNRMQILEYARQYDLHWVEDESNQNPDFLRNRLRHQLIPQLLEINPSFDRQIDGLTRQIQIEEDYWQGQVAQQFDGIVLSRHDGLRVRRDTLLAMHPALRMRILREALRQLRGDLQGIEAIHLQAIEKLLLGQRSQAQLDLPGCWVARRYEVLWLRERQPPAIEGFDLPLPLTGEVELPDGRILRTSVQDELEGESAEVTEYSLTDLSSSLRVRSWQSGDRFSPLGMDGHKRLKKFFSDNQVEREIRLKIPLLIGGDEILWVAGMRRSNYAIAGHDKGRVLRVELI